MTYVFSFYNFDFKMFVKRLLYIFLALIVFSVGLMFNMMEAQALSWAALAGSALPAAGALLVAAGLTFVTYNAIKNTAEWWYSSSGYTVRQQFLDSVGSMQNGIINVPDGLWEHVKAFVNSNFVIGSVSVPTNIHFYTLDDGKEYPYSLDSEVVFPIGDSFTFPSDCYFEYFTRNGFDETHEGKTIWLEQYGTTDKYYQVIIGGEELSPSSSSSLSFFYNYANTECIAGTRYDFYLVRTSGCLCLWVRYVDEYGNVERARITRFKDISATQVHYESVTATGDELVGSADNDIASENDRAVAVPESLDLNDLLNKSRTDVNASGETGTGGDTGTGAVLEEITVDPTAIVDSITGKLGVNSLKSAFNRLNEINTGEYNAPVIRINLYNIFRAGTRRFNVSSNPFEDRETVFIDFGLLEDYSFGGMNVIEYFRLLISAGFIYTTLLYVWRKIIPDKAVG